MPSNNLTIQQAVTLLRDAEPGMLSMRRDGHDSIMRLMNDTLQEQDAGFSHMHDVDFNIDDILANDWTVE